jgi:hypothetical protein
MDYKSSRILNLKEEGMTQLKRVRRLAAILLALASLASAKKQQAQQHAPLPAKVLESKTIYLQNDSGWAEMADRAYAQLKAWGKYQVVDVKEKADLILVLAVTTEQTEGTRHKWVNLHNSETGAWTNGTVPVASTQTLKFTEMRLIDAATGDTAWADRQAWSTKRSSTEVLILSFRQRVEEQEKQSAR